MRCRMEKSYPNGVHYYCTREAGHEGPCAMEFWEGEKPELPVWLAIALAWLGLFTILFVGVILGFCFRALKSL